MQISALAIKSGNGVLLKGGQEALHSCRALVKAIQAGLAASPVAPEAVALLTSRAETLELLNLDQYVNLIIPPWLEQLCPVCAGEHSHSGSGHAEGICHLYVDQKANVAQAVEVAVDSKIQYPAACNAIRDAAGASRDRVRVFTSGGGGRCKKMASSCGEMLRYETL